MVILLGLLSILLKTAKLVAVQDPPVDAEQVIDAEDLNLLCGNKQLSQDTSCHEEKRMFDAKPVDEKKNPLPEGSIFFIETSCNGVLNLRQACAVESAARAHPHRSVNVLFAGPVIMKCLKTSPMFEILSYDNVNIYRILVNDYLKHTPLEEFVESRAMYLNFFRVRHISDVLAAVTLYKFGGVYLDLDVLVVKPFDFLPESLNFVGRESGKKLGSAVLAMSKQGIGRAVSFDLLNVFKENFGQYSMGENNVKPVTRSLIKVCNTTKPSEMDSSRCNGFQVYPPVRFYPISYKNWEKYFTRFNECISHKTIAFHTWEQLSHTEVIYDDSLYGQLMKFFCPRIYKLMMN